VAHLGDVFYWLAIIERNLKPHDNLANLLFYALINFCYHVTQLEFGGHGGLDAEPTTDDAFDAHWLVHNR